MAVETKCRQVYLPGCCMVLNLMLLAALALLIDLLLNPSPSRLFRRYVLDPIPASVTEIKSDRPWEFTGHRYILQFRISKDDLDLILNSRLFKEVKYLKYYDGNIVWEESPRLSQDLTLYNYPEENRPSWFRPELWKNPKAYAFQEQHDRKHIQILLYNEQLNQVYFIEYKEGH
jgi:hypothetical protein